MASGIASAYEFQHEHNTDPATIMLYKDGSAIEQSGKPDAFRHTLGPGRVANLQRFSRPMLARRARGTKVEVPGVGEAIMVPFPGAAGW